jgi:hypothetical protein
VDGWCVVDQLDAETGKFDEHKVLTGFRVAADALEAYNELFSDRLGPF